MLDVGDIKVRVKRAFGDESAVQMEDADLIRWINDAQREIVMNNEGLLEKITTENLVAGDDEYNFPADCLVLRSVRVKLDTDVFYTSLKWHSLASFDEQVNGWDTNDVTGRPVMYTTYAQKIYLYPRPESNATNGLKWIYSHVPTEVDSDDDLLSLPVAYHNLVVKYCLIKANEMDEDFNISGNMLAQFEKDLGVNREKEKWGARELYPSITVTVDDSW